MLKECRNCKESKDISLFHYYKKANNKLGYKPDCKLCANAKNKIYAKEYRKTDNYKKSIIKYQKTNKYKSFVKDRLIIKNKIKFINIYLHKCKCCKSMFYNKESDLKYELCLKCNTEENQINFYNKYKTTLRDCVCSDCGKTYLGKMENKRCYDCRGKVKKESRKEFYIRYGRTHKDRAKYFGCYYEKVDKIKVFERDKYICKDCGIKCNPNQHYNKRDYPTLGHIVPLSLKGSHTYANVQCECRDCNTLKSNKIFNQQLTIFFNGGTG